MCASCGSVNLCGGLMLARLQCFGLTKLKLRSGQDNVSLALVARVAAKRPQPTISEQAPVRSHQSLGGVERWHRLLQEQVRTIRLQLEDGIKGALTSDMDVMP